MNNQRAPEPNAEHATEREPGHVDRGTLKLKNDFAENNPCHQEIRLVQKCQVVSHYKRGACAAYEENFRQCKRFWNKVWRDRAVRGLPGWPEPSELEAVKKEYSRDGIRLPGLPP